MPLKMPSRFTLWRKIFGNLRAKIDILVKVSFSLVLVVMESLLYSIPYLLIYLIGIGLSIATWRQHPRVSLLTAIAFLLFIGSLAFDFVMVYWINHFAMQNPEQVPLAVGMLNIIRIGISTVGWGLILAAIFTGGRND